MANSLRVKTGTRALIETARGAGGLFAGEPYLIADEARLGVGTGPNALASMVASDDVHAIRYLTQAAYDLLSPPDASTLYVISDAVPVFYLLRQIQVTANITLNAGNVWCRVKTGAGAYTITLPVAPVAGDLVQVTDADGNAGTNAITIGRNGKTIGGAASNFVIDTAITGPLGFVYDGSGNWEYA